MVTIYMQQSKTLTDWVRAFLPINREPEFSQPQGLDRKIENHKIFYFRLPPA